MKEALLSLLGDYFSAPIAQLFYSVTLRRSELDPDQLKSEDLPRAVQLLIEALPAFLIDKNLRAACAGRLEGLLEKDQVLQSAPRVDQAGETVAPLPIAVDSRAVNTAEDVLATSALVRDVAERVGFSPLVQTKIATAVTELARNLQLYAHAGRVEVATIGRPPRGIEVVSTDRGPGIANLDAIFAGKYRSRTGMGMGLRGTRRLMDTFDITSSPSGTRVVVRKYLT